MYYAKAARFAIERGVVNKLPMKKGSENHFDPPGDPQERGGNLA